MSSCSPSDLAPSEWPGISEEIGPSPVGPGIYVELLEEAPRSELWINPSLTAVDVLGMN